MSDTINCHTLRVKDAGGRVVCVVKLEPQEQFDGEVAADLLAEYLLRQPWVKGIEIESTCIGVLR